MPEVKDFVPQTQLRTFCARWKVESLAVFGSALRNDFSKQSDVDILVSFSPHSNWSLFDHIQMKQELTSLFGREVDLITQAALEQSRNSLLRAEILDNAKPLFHKHDRVHVQASR
jgi:uncharacterized protein